MRCPCPQCHRERDALEATCPKCGWSPPPLANPEVTAVEVLTAKRDYLAAAVYAIAILVCVWLLWIVVIGSKSPERPGVLVLAVVAFLAVRLVRALVGRPSPSTG